MAICVTDTGIGIGTGLGLPIAKSFVERHGGSLVVRSEIGKGTEVQIELPADRIMGAVTPGMQRAS